MALQKELESTRLKELLEVVAKSLVDDASQVEVSLVDGERSSILELRVARAEMGKVIGKQGRIAQAIRTIIRAAAVKDGKKVMVEIIE